MAVRPTAVIVVVVVVVVCGGATVVMGPSPNPIANTDVIDTQHRIDPTTKLANAHITGVVDHALIVAGRHKLGRLVNMTTANTFRFSVNEGHLHTTQFLRHPACRSEDAGASQSQTPQSASQQSCAASRGRQR
jgi:hypothetical protein